MYSCKDVLFISKKLKLSTHWQLMVVIDSNSPELLLTNFSKQIFSLNAPIQPVNPKINIMPPTRIKKNAGSDQVFPTKSE